MFLYISIDSYKVYRHRCIYIHSTSVEPIALKNCLK